ncbi:MAG: oxygen-independent coproporphyrinogen III oxidase [Sphingobacteriales bacterium 17-39-43]|uniref:oxygen-independent coproporphyrinogen III oxidase n=1 Tax=Daejeonella sp. TaxID=2805397 RepID=UPI000BC43497|nr:oxygen-independent coproporphyrinogen III oxidase [Daejeonella sp.]MCF8452126.1 oxygen-independent coproporphyrinogen III oxidase [Pedobacter sp.]OYZ31916.1 MAG: oxygen-independent coproporphyrinogen III oxidase [Sphingobacteriales bacterium 16-39-50]OZA25221.1 MAG: oxygen-independent coproporphyrinogen III oxidase [Sphingobacteriales bacterium 17-39-43]OZA57459.1 MAG: oxygen-independent coproporphyrinogen III oxidase [Sphingobacteriales bacterium 39-40-5]HQS52151.1 oxygen-independent copro
MNTQNLINKYHVAAPRYTSYPTVPYWNTDVPDISQWKESVKFSFDQSNSGNGISLYVHLPFCESLCTYCGCNTRITRNHQVEDPYIQAVLKEWTLYREVFAGKPKIKEIHLGGGTPTFFAAENLKLLINGLTADADLHPDAEFSFEAHPNNTREDHLRTLYDLGFRRLSLGIQDFDPKVQKIINRMQSFEQVKAVTELAREIGYTSINFDLIYGLPLQTYEGLGDTIFQVEKLMPDRIAFYSYAHVPWIKPGQRSFTEADLPSVDEKQSLYELGRQMFTSMGYEEIGMDHFALSTDSLFRAEHSGKLHRNFMGYTHQYTQLMVGLGVSSISDSWFAFAQNVKKVEDYLELVNNGKLPVFKGHHLTEEDLIIRKHILNLMCKGKTDWNINEPLIDAMVSGLERAKTLQEDGLLIIEDHSLTVTPLGKRFLRNICMAFDAHLWASQPETQLFSMAG